MSDSVQEEVSFQEEVSVVTAWAERKIGPLQERRRSLQAQLEEVERQIDVLRDVVKIAGKVGTVPRKSLEYDISSLHGLSLSEALVKIAWDNNDEIISTEVRPLLSDTGILPQETRRATSRLSTFFRSNTDRFEKIGRGHYRLLLHEGELQVRMDEAMQRM